MMATLSSLGLDASLAWIVFTAACMLVISVGAILLYHWFNYAHNVRMSIVASFVYISVSFALLSNMAAALAQF